MVEQRVPPPLQLTEEERNQIGPWCKKEYPRIFPQIDELWNDCRDYYIMRGERGYQFKNGGWAACFRRWIRNEANPDRMRRYQDTMPYEKRDRVQGSDLKTVLHIIKGASDDRDEGNNSG